MKYDAIISLAKEAGYKLDMFGYGHWDSPEFKKFVKLLIQECGCLADQFSALGCPESMNIIDTKPSDYINHYFGIQ